MLGISWMGRKVLLSSLLQTHGNIHLCDKLTFCMH